MRILSLALRRLQSAVIYRLWRALHPGVSSLHPLGHHLS